MSVKIMTRVWEDKSLTKQPELLLLLALADWCDDQGYCYPSIDTIALKCRSTQRHVQRMLSGLNRLRKIEIEYNGGPHKTNRYRLLAWGVTNGQGDIQVPDRAPDRIPDRVPPLSPDPSVTISNHQEPPETTNGSTKVIRQKFSVPTIEEMNLYGAKIGLPPEEVIKCYDYYESNGWKVGRNPMRSWEATMRKWKTTWEERRSPQAKPMTAYREKENRERIPINVLDFSKKL